MSQTQQPSHTEQQSSTHRPTGEPPFLYADSESKPKVQQFFNPVNSKHRYLPYDPDTVMTEFLEHKANTSDSPGDEREVSVDSVANIVADLTGIEFNDIVKTRASLTLQGTYNVDDFTVLLHLIQAHAELLEETTIAVSCDDYPFLTHSAHREPRLVVATRILKRRIHYGALYCGKTLKRVLTQPISRETQTPAENVNNNK